ncbi:hypothetical protein QOZ80_1BG0078720 [Eleusine coracana subsp. coracana]|nr:hypothetical protein QOZ80_1BG0078720 [Eleusine coracana subsp. coracana]
MALVKKHSLPTYHLCFILLLSTFSLASIAAPASDPALCVIPSPAPKHIPAAGKDALALLQSFQLTAGYFVGGEELHFAQEEGDDWSYDVPRSFSLFPHRVERTEGDSGLLHVGATLTLSGGRSRLLRGEAGLRRRSYLGGHTVSFSLDGYYSNSTSGELCMTGAGSYSEDDDGTIQSLPNVVLKLRLPNPPSLTDPFVSGSVQGAGFKAISLVAYGESDSYRYGKPASCASISSRPSLSHARDAFHAIGGANFSCARLKKHLVSSFKLRYSSGDASPPVLSWLHEPRMHVSQMRCTADGEGALVRAYVSFSNDTETRRRRRLARRPNFTVKEEAVISIAEGRWDSGRNVLCLRACRVARSESEPTSLAVRPQECGIGMSFWFPGVWTIHDRSAVVGMLWNSSQAAGGAVSASSIDLSVHTSNFSDVEYTYTMVDKAKGQYLLSDLSKSNTKKTKGWFISANHTYRDFEFRYHDSDYTRHLHGHAIPVAIGSVMVYGDRLAADDSFSLQHAVVNKDNDKDELLKVSYEIRHSVPPAGWVRPTNTSSYAVSLEQHLIMAEGVYDPKTGVLCMIGCRELNSSTDCEMLITVQFASLETKALQHGKGAISSLREKADPLFFNKTEIMLYGMYTEDISESISRMDMESIMLAVSTTLPCVFTVLQILHAKRNPDASAATSITMLVVMALGYVAPLLVGSGTLFTSRRTRWVPFESYVPYELNQAMMRAPTLIALLLQLRLIQLALSSRKSAPDQSKAETSSAAERLALWVCLPLYSAGAALTIIVNVINRRRAEASLTVYVGPGSATLWQDLVSSAGLALDAFLLPQVAMNVFSVAGGVVIRRALSPWFYVGGTVVRSMPHVYDVIRRQGYAPSVRPSYVYADPRDDRFGLAWDVAVPCVAGLLAVLLYLQQRRAGALLPRSRSRKAGGYEMVSSI